MSGKPRLGTYRSLPPGINEEAARALRQSQDASATYFWEFVEQGDLHQAMLCDAAWNAIDAIMDEGEAVGCSRRGSPSAQLAQLVRGRER